MLEESGVTFKYFDTNEGVVDNLIIYEEREIKPTGARKGSFPDERKIKEYLFEDEFSALTALVAVPFAKNSASFLYPGCGADVLFPLLYMERLFPQLKEAELTLVDTQDNQKLIETVLDDIGLPFSRKKNKLHFYWKETFVIISFVVDNIFGIIGSLPTFDIYFERAFRIMKDAHPDYEQKIVEKLSPGGILISDSGFQGAKLRKIEVPPELSKYGEMVVGRKEI